MLWLVVCALFNHSYMCFPDYCEGEPSCDAIVFNLQEHHWFELCLEGPGTANSEYCNCAFDVDADDRVDLFDFSELQNRME